MVITGICARDRSNTSPLAGPLGVWESFKGLHFLFDVVVHHFRKTTMDSSVPVRLDNLLHARPGDRPYGSWAI